MLSPTLVIKSAGQPSGWFGIVVDKFVMLSTAIYMFPLMSRIERKYCLISTSCLTGLFGISILLHI